MAESLRILHWNIHSWLDESGQKNTDAVAALIRETRPHVVSLVEVEEPWGGTPTLTALANRCGYASFFAPTFEYGTEHAPSGSFGNALLARLPIIEVRQWHLVWPPRIFDGSEPSEPRSVLLAKYRVHGGSLTVGSLHLPRAESDTRQDAFQRLGSLLPFLDPPFVICGDYNMPAAHLPQYSDAVTVCPDPPQPTYPADRPVEAIDYCIASTDTAVAAQALPRHGSDHLPVLFSLQHLIHPRAACL